MFCPKCGNQNADGNRFCKKCGRQLPDRSLAVPSAPAGLIGQVLDGKYRIDARLGSGGMGDVYRATRILIGDSVAIKILHPQLARDPLAAERFRREAVMATRLRHRNIVGIFDVGISAAHHVPYILMELAEGYTLRQVISEYRVMPLEFAVTVTTQVCLALDEAHSLGIVHRDIKPENIVANETTTGWSIKVLDFGIAKLANQTDSGLTQDGSAMGTPQYMSPEQCMGEPLDGRSDIYSAGIMLYEMLSGRVPFKFPAASAVAIHQVQTQPAPPTQFNAAIHPAVEAVVLRAIEKKSENRQQKASELSRELIQAATIAFRSGFTAPADEPIAAPDIEPEFTAADGMERDDDGLKPASEEDISPYAGAEATAPEEPVDEPAKIPRPAEKIAAAPEKDDPYATVPKGKRAKRSRDKKPAKSAATAPTPPAGAEAENLAIEPESSPPADETLGAGSPTVVRPDDPADASAGEMQEFIAVPIPAEFTESREDLTSVFEDAELRLDEILTEAQPAAHREKTTEATAVEPTAQPFLRTEDSAESDNETPFLASIGSAHKKTDTNLKPWLAAGLGAVVLLLALSGIAAWMFFDAGEQSTAAAQPSEATGATVVIPAGMVYVPGGEFLMGSDKGDEYSRPAHAVSVKSFFIDATEVTNEQYQKFVIEKQYAAPPTWKEGKFPQGKAKFPVTGVTWDDANAYAAWAGKRLPTEQEWEFAARGTDGRKYPWGDEWDPAMANAAGRASGVREVGQGGKSPFGAFDMAGNAWEWTATEPAAYPGGEPAASKGRNPRIIRGGYFGSSSRNASAVTRAAYGGTDEKEGYPNITIRCVKDP